MIEAVIDPTFESWQEHARDLVARGIAPEHILWAARGEQPLLPIASARAPDSRAARVRVPRRFIELARAAACHRAADRWSLLYRVLWRLARGGGIELDDRSDADAARLQWVAQQVRQDVHRMLAFVRFRQVEDGEGKRLVAWYVPDHDVARLVAPHFAARYPKLRWSILTPLSSVHCAKGVVTTGAGVPASQLPQHDTDEAAEALWRVYYASAFNPARLNPSKLLRDMPVRFWQSLPEAREIPALVASAPSAAADLRARTGGATDRASVPATLNLEELKSAAASCRSCPLHEGGTQTVFGEGVPAAPLMLVGEQPGDLEDRCGRPFVGPAGKVLDRALAQAGIRRGDLYVTNAVKHFGWEPRGKWRIHRTPRLSEIQACRPWLERELAAVRPRVLVLLGGVAARALLGPQARVAAMRGTVLSAAWAPSIVVTFHPSAVLRAGEADAQERTFDLLVADLQLAAGRLATALTA